jgi:branched-subunit amino acid transport protein
MEALVTWLSAWGLNDWNPWTFLTILLMACVTVITRCFFFISDTPWTLPSWAQRGMQYAPIAALSAVVLPEV